MHHVMVITATGSGELIAAFAVDLLNLLYISLLGEHKLATVWVACQVTGRLGHTGGGEAPAAVAVPADVPLSVKAAVALTMQINRPPDGTGGTPRSATPKVKQHPVHTGYVSEGCQRARSPRIQALWQDTGRRSQTLGELTSR